MAYILAYTKSSSPGPIPTDITHLRVTSASGSNVPAFILSTYTSTDSGRTWRIDNTEYVEIYNNNNVYTLEWGWTGGRYKYVGTNPWENPWTAEIDDEDDPTDPISGTSINVVPYIP